MNYKKTLNVIKIIVLFIGMISVQKNLKAQIYCQGDGCSYLPINDSQLNNIFYALQYNYLNEVLDDMSTANAFSLVNTVPSTMVNLNELTIGVAATLAQTKTRKIDVFVPDYGTIEDVPSVGVSLIPNLFLGTNIGYLFSSKPTQSYLPWYSPHRFDIIISYLNSGTNNEEVGKTKKNESWEVKSKSYGLDLRYHLAQGDKEISYLFGFSGVSVGIGYHKVNQTLDYIQKDYKFTFNASSNTDLIWKGDNTFQYNNKMDIYSVDIRTGIQLLYFFRFSIGAGHSWLKGSSDIQLNRFGPITVSNDFLTLLGYNVPDTYLGILLQGNGSPKQKNITYLSIGLELNIPIFKIFVELKGNTDIYSGSFGVRMSL